jgi:hypothetical protein
MKYFFLLFFLLVKALNVGAYEYNSNSASSCRYQSSCTIPEGVTSIDDYTFYNSPSGVHEWANLTSVTLPTTLKHIGNAAFGNTEITSILLPDGLETIGNGAFDDGKIESLIIPDSVQNIGRFAFANNPIKNLMIGSGISEITDVGPGAFYQICKSLESFTTKSSASLGRGESYSPSRWESYSPGPDHPRNPYDEEGSQHWNQKRSFWYGGLNFYFAKCDSLKEITLSEGVTYVGNNVFRGLDNLTDLTIANTVEQIENAFEGMPNLNELIIPDSVEYIGANAFSQIPSITALNIPNSVVYIGDNAFSGASALLELDIPNSVTELGSGAFNGLTSIKSFVIPDSLTDIPTDAFRGAVSLESINFPETLVSIKSGAFAESGLKSLEIPDTIKSIGSEAFSDGKLESIKIGNGVTNIGSNAFHSNKISSIELGSSIYTIQSGAFSNNLIYEVIIPDSTNHIGNHAFSYNRIKTLILGDTLEHIGSDAFKDNRIEQVVIPDSVRHIGSGSFQNNSINYVIFGSNLSELGVSSFSEQKDTFGLYIDETTIVIIEGENDIYDLLDDAFLIANGVSNSTIFQPTLSLITCSTEDFDNDLIIDCIDEDDDNDSAPDIADAFPLDPTEQLDTDGDGIGNNADPDDDNDGLADEFDDLPLNASEQHDFDNDGIGNNADADDDNDGLSDQQELILGTNSWLADTDLDGVNDGLDAFPIDNSETTDTDADGIGNNADNDDDNDGYVDIVDAMPTDINEWADTDADGIGNNADTDDDNDGVEDAADAFPYTASESVDTDGDGTGDNADVFPNDPTEAFDTDLDGIGNNADPDDDNDGVADADDDDPLDNQVGVLLSQRLFINAVTDAVNGYPTIVSIGYDVSDNNDKLNGIGFRVHYDSSIIKEPVIQNTFPEAYVIQGIGPYQDDQNYDNDIKTDSYLVFGWASLSGQWPSDVLPAKLMDIKFYVDWNNDEATSTETPINLSVVDGAEGYEVDKTDLSMTVIAANWDFDGNGTADALTDGLMLLRYTFGIRDFNLTANAMSGNSTRSIDEVVESVTRSEPVADIDGNGSSDALTDGLMLLRYLFGLRGENLVVGAISANATRTNQEMVEEYINLHMPKEINPEVPVNVNHLNFQSGDEIILQKYGQDVSVSFSTEKNAHVKVTNQSSIPITTENTLTAGHYGGGGYTPSSISADIARLENGNFYVGYVINGGNSWGTSYVNAYYQLFTYDGQTIGPTVQFLSAKGESTPSIYFDGDEFEQLSLSVNWVPDTGRPVSTKTVFFSTLE